MMLQRLSLRVDMSFKFGDLVEKKSIDAYGRYVGVYLGVSSGFCKVFVLVSENANAYPLFQNIISLKERLQHYKG